MQLAAFLDAAARLCCSEEWELIVVDNGSVDGTCDVVAAASGRLSDRVRLVQDGRMGLGRARNTGWRAARGELVAFVDDDCRPAQDYLDQVVQLFRAHPEVGFASGRVVLGDAADARQAVTRRTRPLRIEPFRFLPAGLVLGANLTFRRPVLAAIGGFDERFGAGTPFPCEDVEAAARAVWSGVRGMFDPGPTVYHHHGRRTRAVAQTQRVYDAGRGAYYWQFLRQRRSRAAYLRGWLGYTSLHAVSHCSVARLWREIRAAVAVSGSHPVLCSEPPVESASGVLGP